MLRAVYYAYKEIQMRQQHSFRVVYIVLLIGMVHTFSCEKKPENEKLHVAVSIFPISDIVQNIAGTSIQVISAVPVNANPHSFEPNPSTVRELRTSKLFIGVHPEFDGWAAKMIAPDGKKFFLSDIIKGDNPHLWLSVKHARLIASAIRDFLYSAFPEKKEEFSKNFNSYDKKLIELDARIASLFAPLKKRKFIQWHPSWDYFARDYKLVIAGTIESGHGDSPSLKEFSVLKSMALKEHITVVVIDYYAQNKTADTFVREIRGKEVRLDGIGGASISGRNTYVSLMEYNAHALAKALSE